MRTGTGLLSRPGEHTEGTLTLISAYFHGEEKKCEAIRRQNFSIPEGSREEALRRLLQVVTHSLTQTNRAFHRMPELSARLKIVVIVDKAHRSQYGAAAR